MSHFHPIRGQRVTAVKVQRSRELRQEMTESERTLWARLRGGQVLGHRFRRQQILHGFIVDFYCHAARLVIELDGSIHAGQVEYDTERDRVLSAHGLRILRFTNDEVQHNISSILDRITAACH